MRILFLTHHWKNNSHHSKYSGFQRLVFFISKKHDVTVLTWGSENRCYIDEEGIATILVKTSKQDLFFLRRLKIAKCGSTIQGQYDVVHALYTDCGYYLPKHKSISSYHISNKITVNRGIKEEIHLYLKYLCIEKTSLNRSTIVSCVSTNLLTSLDKKTKSKAIFIPHGIDTEFWKPRVNTTSACGNYILTVGFNGVNTKILKLIIQANTDKQFVIVNRKKLDQEFVNVVYKCNLSDLELREVYNQAYMVLRPLHFATANNSLLEAMSLKIPILTNKIPGVLDYLSNNDCYFIEDLDNYKIEFNHIEAENKSCNALDRVNNEFSWVVIAEKFNQLYLNFSGK